MGRKDFKSQFQNVGKSYASAITKEVTEPANFTEHVAEKLEVKDEKITTGSNSASSLAGSVGSEVKKPSVQPKPSHKENNSNKKINPINDMTTQDSFVGFPIKKTSLSLDKNVAAYISINSKLNGINQNLFLSSMLEQKMNVIRDIQPDYLAEKRTRNSKVGTIVRTFDIPEPIFNWMKRQSALRQMSASLFVNDIVAESMEN